MEIRMIGPSPGFLGLNCRKATNAAPSRTMRMSGAFFIVGKSIIHGVLPICRRPAALALIAASCLTAVPAAQRGATPLQASVDVARLDAIPPLVEQAMADKK